MSVRRRAVIGLLAAASLVLTGCAGEAVDDGPDEPSLTMPPEESTSTSADTVLDLETMTDDELLAEAERAYQGWLDDMERLHADGSSNYTTIDSWATSDFLELIDEAYRESRPDGYEFEGVQTIVEIRLIDRPHIDRKRYVSTAVCLDNSSLRLQGPDGSVIERDGDDQFSAGETYFAVSEDGTHLKIYSETRLTDENDSPCDG